MTYFQSTEDQEHKMVVCMVKLKMMILKDIWQLLFVHRHQKLIVVLLLAMVPFIMVNIPLSNFRHIKSLVLPEDIDNILGILLMSVNHFNCQFTVDKWHRWYHLINN